MQPLPGLASQKGVNITNSIVKVEQRKPFQALLDNFTTRAQKLPKHMHIGTLCPGEASVIHSPFTLSDFLFAGDYAQKRTITRNEQTVAMTSAEVEEMDFSHVPEQYHERI